MDYSISENIDDTFINTNSICAFNFNSKYCTYSHSHKFIEIGFVVKGQGVFNFDKINHGVSSGDIIITLPNTFHYETGFNDDNFEVIYITFKNSFSLNKYFSIPFPTSTILDTKGLPDIYVIFKNILIESINEKEGYKYFIEAELIKLFIILNRQIKGNFSDTYKNESLSELMSIRKLKLVTQIKEYIDNNIYTKINLNTVAQKFYISPQHLIRLFKEITEYPPKQYITICKLEKAKEFLIFSNEDIVSIAEKLGFSSIHYFYRFFKNHTGVTPLQYREINSSKVSTKK